MLGIIGGLRERAAYRAQNWPLYRGLFERRCHYPSPVVAFEEASTRVPHVASVQRLVRRGPAPGLRRTLASRRAPARRDGAMTFHFADRVLGEDVHRARRLAAIEREPSCGARRDNRKEKAS